MGRETRGGAGENLNRLPRQSNKHLRSGRLRQKKIDPQTVEVVRKRLNIYLESWVRPLLEKSIDKLK